MPIVRYLDPKNDIAFKKIFGSEKNKDILIHFLNDILGKEPGNLVTEVTLLNTEQNPEIASQKQSIVDVLCTDENQIKYIVEMQVSKIKGFEKRAQYYAAKAYINQMNEGGKYWNLKEVIFLAIANFTMFPEKPHYKSDHVILDKNSHERNLKDFSFTFIELPKFKKTKVEDLKTYEEKWCYFFKNAGEPENIEKLIAESDEVIKKAYNELLSHNWTDKELMVYEQISKRDMDNIAREDQLRDEGIAQGRVEGIEEGMAKGKIEGLEEGQYSKATEIAQRLLSEKMDIKQVAGITGLSEREVEKLKNS